ncbi:MAG: cyclic nucleotide-binding domain-containing protein [Methyloprofundus sp.]|nr:cyclic nucleotide-binding domain-containing protein [Methyloprofundus sp.]
METILKEIIEDPQFVKGIAWKQRHFNTNDVIVKQGDLGETLFVIQEGILRVTGHVKLGEHKNIQPGFCDLEKGSVFGETCLYQFNRRMATVTAVTEGNLIELDGFRLSVFFDAHPALGYLFYKKNFEVFVTRLNKANQRVEFFMAWGLKAHEIDKFL